MHGYGQVCQKNVSFLLRISHIRGSACGRRGGSPHYPTPKIKTGTVQFSRYSVVQHSTVQYSSVQYSTVQSVQCGLQHSTVQYSTLHNITVQYSTVQSVQLKLLYSTGNYGFKNICTQFFAILKETQIKQIQKVTTAKLFFSEGMVRIYIPVNRPVVQRRAEYTSLLTDLWY